MRLSTTAAAALFAVFGAASANASAITTTILTSDGAQQMLSTSLLPFTGATPIDLSGAPLGASGTDTLGGGVSLTFGANNGQGVVQGSSPSSCYISTPNACHAAPIIDAAGDGYIGKYLSTSTGAIAIDFTSNQKTFQLLWGSVDAGNEIEFYENTTQVGYITGSNITANANGSQGFGGSFYTSIENSLAFNQIILTSSVNSFEAVPLAAATIIVPPSVPEPASNALFSVALFGLAYFGRRRGKAA